MIILELNQINTALQKSEFNTFINWNIIIKICFMFINQFFECNRKFLQSFNNN